MGRLNEISGPPGNEPFYNFTFTCVDNINGENMDLHVNGLPIMLLKILTVSYIAGRYDHDDVYALDYWLDDSVRHDSPPDTTVELDRDFAWTVISAAYLTLVDKFGKGGPDDFFFQSCQIFDDADEIRMSFSTETA